MLVYVRIYKHNAKPAWKLLPETYNVYKLYSNAKIM